MLILVIPVIAYLGLTTGKHHIKELGFYGPKEEGPKSGDTIYHTIPAFQLTDQNGHVFTEKNLEGKIYVANFFFTSCPSVCKKMQTLMKKVQDEDDFKRLKDFRMVSYTVDPERDTPEKLREYASLVHADTSRWIFLSGKRQEIYDLAYKGYMANAMEDSIAPGGFLHSELMFLIDRERHIRGIYQGTDLKDVKRLIDEIKVLIASYNSAKKENIHPVR